MRRQARLIFTVAQGNIVAVVKWNGVVVYKGAVIGDIEWSIPATTWGDQTLAFDLEGHGSLTWIDLHMNYTGCRLCLPGSESSGKRRVAPKDFWSSPSMDVDCRHDMHVNGEILAIDRDTVTQGAWHYELVAPCRVDAQIRIDRAKTMLWSPVV